MPQLFESPAQDLVSKIPLELKEAFRASWPDAEQGVSEACDRVLLGVAHHLNPTFELQVPNARQRKRRLAAVQNSAQGLAQALLADTYVWWELWEALGPSTIYSTSRTDLRNFQHTLGVLVQCADKLLLMPSEARDRGHSVGRRVYALAAQEWFGVYGEWPSYSNSKDRTGNDWPSPFAYCLRRCAERMTDDPHLRAQLSGDTFVATMKWLRSLPVEESDQ